LATVNFMQLGAPVPQDDCQPSDCDVSKRNHLTALHRHHNQKYRAEMDFATTLKKELQ
jgi:hypothetical protein